MLLLLLAQLAAAGSVTLDLETWRALQPPDPIEAPGHGPMAASRDLELWWDGAVLRFRGTWRLEAQEAGWLRVVGAGPEVTVTDARWDGAPVGLREGALEVVGRVDRPVVLTLEGRIAGDPTTGPVPFSLLGAVRGTTRIDAPGRVARLDGTVPVDGIFWGGDASLALRLEVPRAPSAEAPLVHGAVALGLTVGEGEVLGRARVRLEPRRGALDAVSLRVQGVGADLEVKGPGVARWSRSGDRVLVELREPERSAVVLDLTWTQALGATDEVRSPIPRIEPDGVFRSETTLQVARDSEREVVPQVSGWRGLDLRALPTWAEGLVTGAATAAYATAGARDGSLGIFRFVPVEAPAVMVDVVDHEAALTADGRMLLRTVYTLRNERAAALGLVLPPGQRLIAVRVGGEPVSPARDGDRWRIALPRSVETVQGLLSFPVELLVLGESEAWDRSEARVLPLPAVDAPTAVSRTTLYLPPSYATNGEVQGLVEAFGEGEGIAYGFGPVSDEAQAEALYRDALSSWMDNDFEEAQANLDELRAMGADNENLVRLQSNLDLMSGDDTGVDVTVARRLKDQARARAVDEERELEDRLREADEALASGDYQAAEQSYKRSLELSGRLSRLEQSESVAQENVQAEVTRRLAETEKREERATIVSRSFQSVVVEEDRRGPPGRKAPPAPEAPPPAPAAAPSTGYDFDGDGPAGMDVLDDYEDALELEIYYDLPEEPLEAPMASEEEALDWGAYDLEGEVGAVHGGVEAGVAGGVLGGVVRGSGRGMAAPATVTARPIVLESVPARRMARGGGGGGGVRSDKKAVMAESAPVRDPEPSPAAPADDWDKPLEITATDASVVIPAFGERVLYQQLLLPALEAPVVTVRAKIASPRRSP